MEQRGTKSGERQRMRNLLLSRDRLARTLAANFTGGDLLVTLTYQAGPRPRSRELARQQVRQWIGSISGLRRAQGMDAKYVYLLGTEQAGSLVHRVILNRGRESASILGHPWPYGPVYVGPLDLSAGAGVGVRAAAPAPPGRTFPAALRPPVGVLQGNPSYIERRKEHECKSGNNFAGK